MEKLTNDQSKTLPQKTSQDLHNVTFSQALVAGLTHSGWLIGQKTDRSGQDRVLASHSVSLAKAQELRTTDTFGPLFDGSLPSAGLQSSLANKLRALMAENGSPEYELTWKHWNMKSGPRICALRASARRISDSGFGGWATPAAQEPGGTPEQHLARKRSQVMNGVKMGCDAVTALSLQVQAVGWPTPNTPNGGRSLPRNATASGQIPGGPKRQADLQHVAKMAGWQTPKLPSGGSCKRNTPGGGMRKLEDQAELLTGKIPLGTNAKTENQDAYRLNPRFSLWLMGYPEEWASCGERAMQSSRKSLKSL
jgi:hypothetical protein